MQRFADTASPRCVGAVFVSLLCVSFEHELKPGRNISGHLCSINGLRTFRAFIRMPSAPDRSTPSEPSEKAPRQVSYVVAEGGDDGQRIDNFLMRVLKSVPRSLVYRILRTGEVRVNGKRAKPDTRLVEGDRIRVPPIATKQREAGAAPSKSLRDFVSSAVIYEDRDLIVINKPAGVAVHGGSGLSHGVIETLRAVHPELKELELVHRLDRDTSGCLLIAK